MLFDEEGVKIMPGTMTVAHFSWEKSVTHVDGWMKSVTRVERFSLNDVTAIRCFEKEESDFIKFCDRFFKTKFLILLLIGGVLTQVPIGLVIGGINTKDYVSWCAVILLIGWLFYFLIGLALEFSNCFTDFCLKKVNKNYWWPVDVAGFVVPFAPYLVSYILMSWIPMLGLVALGLCLAGMVYCVWVGAKVSIWLNIELLHGNKTTICYKEILVGQNGVRMDENLAKCNRIMNALNRAISIR